MKKMTYIIGSIILIIILYLLKNLNIGAIPNIEKNSIYECGFSEFEAPQKKYYMKFYLLAILFLIFDLETLILYPQSLSVLDINNNTYIYIIYIFYIITIGLGIEIYNKLIE